MKKSLFAFCFFFVCLIFVANPGVSEDGVWRDVPRKDLIPIQAERQIIPERYRTVFLDVNRFKDLIANAPLEFTQQSKELFVVMSLPLPDGKFGRFQIQESPIMEPGLASKYPEIKTFRGQGLDDRTATMRMGWTSAGFHAIILSASGTVYIDPYRRGDTNLYISYFKKHYRKKEDFQCLVEGAEVPSLDFVPHVATGDSLRTYRLAVGCTGEYTQFHGGTKDSALNNGVIPTVNRVTGIYERDVAVRMVLIANETDVIFDDPLTDPYTNNNGGTMLSQNQTTLDSIIGSANYDIGHAFSTGGGGVAFLRAVCVNSNKAKGVTGLSNPIGDPYDVDYVAHEMGHQFGGNHSFNGTTSSCSGNRVSSTAYEPGSGSTIMAYAGICGSENLQPHSDDYFHRVNLNEIVSYTNSGNGNGCPQTTATGNTAPTVNAGPDYTIPKSTPFILTASGQDTDGDALTYCWEEFDLGTASPPNTDNGNRPIFRSFNPTADPSRTFPKLQDILANSSTLGESLPITTRNMNFRVTVRDNAAGSGGQNDDLMILSVTSTAGPFAVTEPNSAVTWAANSVQTVSWDVTGTNLSPVNTSFVNILLSTDGGNTFPVTLSANTPNDGSELITVPDVSTSNARVKVEAAGNVYFDISNSDFPISGSCPPVNISPASLPDGKVNRHYNQTITATGGLGPFTFSKVSGRIPPGLRFKSDGTLVGRPIKPGVFQFMMAASDSSGCTGFRTYTLTILNRVIP